MMLATVTFAADGWRVPVLLLLGLGAAAVLWSYGTGAPGTRRWGCAALKLAGLVLLALCVLEPQWTSPRVRPGANLFAVVADNSQGLQLTDAGAAETRAAQLATWLDPARQSWPQALADNFDVRRFAFDTRLQPVEDFGTLAFDGRASSLGSALQTLSARFRGRPLAGVLLFTDGNATDWTALPTDLPELPPVYPVVVGSAGPARDVSVQQVTVAQSAFEDAPVTLAADIVAMGVAGQRLAVWLVDPTGKEIDRQEVEAPRDGMVSVRFQLKPEAPGLSFYRLEARLVSELAAGVPETSEATLANNQRVVVVTRGRGPYRVLYVSGRPNWEYKFLQRAVQADREVELVGLVRMAKREPKFDFRGRAGESGNPLFRGFDKQSREEAGSYDQPVLVRLNTRDELELKAGFPAEPQELFAYRAIILDDLEAAFFKPEQAALVQRFVAERGGGLLMLGGMESFREGGFHRTPIGEVLPVYLDRGEESPGPPGPMKFDLDREGWLQGWARLRQTEVDERARLDAMPTFQVFNRVRGVKPGAGVMATGADATGQAAPALVVQRFGRGRSAALTVGDFWRWGMRSAEVRPDFEKAWRQLVRWLVSDTPDRVEATATPDPADPGGAVRLQVRVRTERFEPLETATVKIEVAPVTFDAAAAGEPPLTLTAEPSLDDPGLYEAAYVPRRTGGYRVRAVALNPSGAEEGRAEAGWSSDLAADEFRALTPNTALLADLARRTGGAVIPSGELDAFVRDLPATKAPITELSSRPLWHTPWVFLLALACFIAEWGWRRTQGLP
jgi:uncharacterized membrane protein